MKAEIARVKSILGEGCGGWNVGPNSPSIWLSFYKDRRKHGYRVVFKNMDQSEALFYLKSLSDVGIKGWEKYENKQQRKFGIKKYFGKLI